MMEKLVRIEYNWSSATEFQFYDVRLNCVSITEISETQCRVILTVNEKEETTSYAIVTNINTKIFESNYLSD